MKTLALSMCLFTMIACGLPPQADEVDDSQVATITGELNADQIQACRSAYDRAVATGDRALVSSIVARCLAIDDGPNRPSVEACRRAYARAVAIGDRDLVNRVIRRCSQ